MLRTKVIVTVSSLLMALATAMALPGGASLAIAAPSPDAFVGRWMNADPGDKSIPAVDISSSNDTLKVRLLDVCPRQTDCDADVRLSDASVGVSYMAGKIALSLSMLGSGDMLAVRAGVERSVLQRKVGNVLRDDALLSDGEAWLKVPFNTKALLLPRISADGFVPNSSEFYTSYNGTSYVAQRAEELGSGRVRVYYTVQTVDATGTKAYGPVMYTERGATDLSNLGSAMLSWGEANQRIEFNPDAALQRRIFQDGFVPNSPEFHYEADGILYAAQRAEVEAPGAMRVRIYYAVVGDWGNVQIVNRPPGWRA